MLLSRYRHLYKRTEELKSVEISRSIREIFGTAHVLDPVSENCAEPDKDQATTRSEEVATGDTAVNIFICPLCGQDFSFIESFSEHNKREHNKKIVQLEMFSYNAGKTQN